MKRAATALLLLVLIPTAGWADSPSLKSEALITAPKDAYIDDAFAVSPDGSKVAYVVVHENGRAYLTFHPSGKSVEITALTDNPQTLDYTPDGKYLLMTWKSSAKAMDGALLDPAGTVKGKFRKITDLTWTRKDGKLMLVAFTEEVLRGGTRYTVALYDPASPKKPKVRKVIRTDIRGRLQKPEEFEVGYFFNNYSKIAVKIIGRYDKKLDRKQPDVKGVYDVFSGKLHKGGIIARSALWDREAAFFRRHPGWDAVVKLTGIPTASGIRGKFLLGTGVDSWQDIKPSGWNISRFSFDSLRQQRRASGGNIFFSLAIDPQNPVILKQKKTEPRAVHFFSVSMKDATARDLGQVPLTEGYARWHIGGKTVAMMVLHETWKVGALKLTIYSIR